MLGLDQHRWLAADRDRVIDLLAALDADIRREFGDNLQRVEHVVAEGVQERQDEGRLGRLLGLESLKLRADAGGEVTQTIDQVHRGLP